MHAPAPRDAGGPTTGLDARWKVALCVFLGIAAFFLITEHTAHMLGVLPYILLLACPLMHLFMHRGNGGHRHGAAREDDR